MLVISSNSSSILFAIQMFFRLLEAFALNCLYVTSLLIDTSKVYSNCDGNVLWRINPDHNLSLCDQIFCQLTMMEHRVSVIWVDGRGILEFLPSNTIAVLPPATSHDPRLQPPLSWHYFLLLTTLVKNSTFNLRSWTRVYSILVGTTLEKCPGFVTGVAYSFTTFFYFPDSARIWDMQQLADYFGDACLCSDFPET